jgi:anti-sigma B factor antagonist
VERSSGAAPPRQPGASGEPDATNGQLLTVQIELLDPDASIVSLAGELDISTIPRVEKRLFAELESHPAVVMDLTRLTFIDSSGIGLLIQAHRLGEHEDGGSLHTVIAPDSQVERVFQLAGIDLALSIHLDRDAAMAAFDPASAQRSSAQPVGP